MSVKVEAAKKNFFVDVTGEGTFWDERSKSLLFVGIQKSTAFHWNPVTDELKTRRFKDSESLSAIVSCEAEGYLACKHRQIVHFKDFREDNDDDCVVLAEIDVKGSNSRFNDAKCDPAGRFWAGTMGAEPKPVQVEMGMGELFSLNPDGSLKKHIDKLDISNGLAWSSDRTKFFLADSAPGVIYAFDYSDKNGTIDNKQICIDYQKWPAEDRMGFPDGMTIDVNDKLWVSCFSGGKVVQFDPETGKRLRIVNIPGAFGITDCCFGGPNMDELFVTSSARGGEEVAGPSRPLEGSLFKITGLGTKGLPGDVFRGKL